MKAILYAACDVDRRRGQAGLSHTLGFLPFSTASAVSPPAGLAFLSEPGSEA